VAFLFNEVQPRLFRLHLHRKDACSFNKPTSHGKLSLAGSILKERNKFYVSTSRKSSLHQWNIFCPSNSKRAFIEQTYLHNNHRKP